MQNEHIHQAIQDLSIIRQAIERAESPTLNDGTPTRTMHFGAHLYAQATALALAVVGLLVEIATGGLNTRCLLASANSENLRVGGLINAASLLFVSVCALYFIVICSAKSDEQTVAAFIARNFRYLKNMSLVTDLCVKFAVFSMIILAPRPEWIAPLLSLYIGDYLFQGRFFSLKTPVALGIGCVAFAVAFAQFYVGNPNVVWPILLFIATAGASVATVVGEKSRAQVTA